MAPTSKTLSLPYRKNALAKLVLANRLDHLNRENSATKSYPIAIFAHDHISTHISVFGFYEREQLEMIFKALSPLEQSFKNGRALDIGANIGNHSIYYSSHFKNVDSFEPHPRIAQLLRFNTDPAENITVQEYGVGDENTTGMMNEVENNIGASSIGKGNIEINIRTIDSFNFDDVEFMKIDVEGFEKQVLRGARETIARCSPILIVEQHNYEFAKGYPETLQIIEDMGYAFGWFSAGSIQGRWNKAVAAIRQRVSNQRTFEFHIAVHAEPGEYLALVAIPKIHWALFGFNP